MDILLIWSQLPEDEVDWARASKSISPDWQDFLNTCIDECIYIYSPHMEKASINQPTWDRSYLLSFEHLHTLILQMH